MALAATRFFISLLCWWPLSFLVKWPYARDVQPEPYLAGSNLSSNLFNSWVDLCPSYQLNSTHFKLVSHHDQGEFESQQNSMPLFPNFAHTFLLFQRALISKFKLFGEELRLQERRLGDSKWSHRTSESGLWNVTHFESFHLQLPLAPYSLVSPDFWQTYVKLQLEYTFFKFVFWIEVAGGQDTNWSHFKVREHWSRFNWLKSTFP
jgi:hypothetical protein